ncbi:MAG TPA: BTAD domain-containing putative transcriptional regulator, partial [Ilumatobacter sp.]|nr:BTAD domain-containing putative transcriptional regulator [Ilumatobacter sp.]
MPRPFRSEPPSPSVGFLERARLVSTVARRWDVRVVSVVAGPGFGKTSLLATEWHRDVPPNATQAWLACEPADESAAELCTSVASALDLPATLDLRAILDDLWSRTPSQVCMVFDDVHEIAAGSPGAEWLSTFVANMSSNVHVVLASRDTLPVPLARLTATGDVVRVVESDLVFSDEEVTEFAIRRGVSKSLLDEAGGWPALVELTATTGGSVPLEFLWEEVLHRMGDAQSGLFARFGLCGGGDDEIASALAGHETSIDALVRRVPLVSRTSDGWAAVHPLWQPALRRLVSPSETRRSQVSAASVHRRRGRFSSAMHLFAEAEAWDELFEVIAEAEHRSVNALTLVASHGREAVPMPHEFGRWYRLLPPARRDEPGALLARAIELQARDPVSAADVFRRAAAGFRSVGDANGELAAISREGVIHWWSNDMESLMVLYGRVVELLADGAERAETLAAVGLAAVAHLGGDSAGVLAALANVEATRADRGWLPTVFWLRSVAYRREGELAKAHRELDRVEVGLGLSDPQMHIARLRIAWLDGDVDRVAEHLRGHYDRVAATEDDFLVREAALEAAARVAWLGDVDGARSLLDRAPSVDGLPNPLASVLAAIARAAIAIEEGDEGLASQALREVAASGPAALGTPGGWYWRDRATMVMLRVLVPDVISAWEAEPLNGSHAVARRLAAAFAAVRANDHKLLTEFEWPSSGVVRAHLPRRWVGELVAAVGAAGNAPPEDLMANPEPSNSRLLNSSGLDPVPVLSVSVLGPLSIQLGGNDIVSPLLRRARVRELLTYLAVSRRSRREVISDDLWPDADDPGHNLRVTLNYLNQMLDPQRTSGQTSRYVLATKDWLSLVSEGSITVDFWQLEHHLDRAEEAERATDVNLALHHYAAALPLWRGEAMCDVSYSAWADPVRTAIRSRYVAAALRAGELWLGAGSFAESG